MNATSQAVDALPAEETMSAVYDPEFRPGGVPCGVFGYLLAVLLVLALVAHSREVAQRPAAEESKDKSNQQAAGDDNEKKALETVKRISDTIRNCGEESEVRSTTGKKPLYYRVHEGPPSAVQFDLQKSDSIVAPWLGIVEFSTYHGTTGNSKTPQQAAVDKRDWLLFLSWTTRHRHLYRIARDTFELDQRTYYNRNNEKWYLEEETPSSCWEKVGYRFGVNESR